MPTFPKAARLRHSLEFRRGFDEGVKVVNPYFVIFAAPGQKTSPKTFFDSGFNQFGVRAGFVVSKKVGNAVIRNRVKRVFRAAFVTVCDQSSIPTNPEKLELDLVILARPPSKDLALSETIRHLRSGILKALQKLNRPIEAGSPSSSKSGALHAPS